MKTSTYGCLILERGSRRAIIDMEQHKMTMKEQSSLNGINGAVTITGFKRFLSIENNLLAVEPGGSDRSYKIVNIRPVKSLKAGLISEL